MGENITVRRATIVESKGALGAYTHGARIGAVVALDGGDEELSRDIAIHVAAIIPTGIDRYNSNMFAFFHNGIINRN